MDREGERRRRGRKGWHCEDQVELGGRWGQGSIDRMWQAHPGSVGLREGDATLIGEGGRGREGQGGMHREA